MRTGLGLLLLVTACATDGKGPEQDVPDDGKADSFAKPTDHGAIPFGQVEKASLAGSAEYHTWTFSLSSDAKIHAFTSRIAHESTKDTVLYLYKKTASGAWGSYIARNDDASASTSLSSISKALGAGDYRVLVKGFDASVKGPFGLEVDCDGAGCAAAPVGCLFGDSQDDLLSNKITGLLRNPVNYKLADYTMFHPASVTDAMVIAALHESAHTDVATVADAFAAADGGEITFDFIYDLAGARQFIGIEYGAGDNPYGAIFDPVTGARVAALHDSDVASCTVTAQTCRLHQNFGDRRADPAWAQVSATTVKSASQLSGAQAANALQAIRVAYSDATSLADGLTKIDQGELSVTVLDNAGTRVEVYDYGAGDNTYGAIFLAGTTTLAAEIHDGDFYACSLD